jgi:hypothetical protein
MFVLRPACLLLFPPLLQPGLAFKSTTACSMSLTDFFLTAALLLPDRCSFPWLYF